MKRTTMLAALAALAAAAAPLAAPARTGPQSRSGLTKSEVRRLPPAETHRRLREMIGDMFEQEDFRSDAPPRHALDTLFLRTRVRPAGLPGLCRYDSVMVSFAPVDGRRGGTPGPDTPMRAAGIESDARFLFVAPPTAPSGLARQDRSASRASACAGIDTLRRASFSAPDEGVANDAMLAFLRLQAALRSHASLPLQCELGGSDTATCEEIVLALDPSAFQSVDVCRAAQPRDNCFRIDVGGRSLEIDTTASVTPGPPPVQPLRARLTTPIVFRDQRID